MIFAIFQEVVQEHEKSQKLFRGFPYQWDCWNRFVFLELTILILIILVVVWLTNILSRVSNDNFSSFTQSLFIDTTKQEISKTYDETKY